MKLTAQQVKELADKLKPLMPAGKAFALVIFDIGDNNKMKDFNYISTAERSSMINVFSALVSKWQNEKSTDN